MLAHIKRIAGAMWSPETERDIMARLMTLPLLEGVACMAIALIAYHAGWIGHGAQPTGILQAVMILVALSVFWLAACGLWHFLGVIWFLWVTRQAKLQEQGDSTSYLLSCLWKLPLVSAVFCWVPLLLRSAMIPVTVPRWTLVVGMVAVQLVVTYLWVVLARGLLRWRHGI